MEEINYPPWAQELLKITLGVTPITTHENLAFDSRVIYTDLASRLRLFRDMLNTHVQKASRALPPGVADPYVDALSLLTGNGGGVDYLEMFARSLDDASFGQIGISQNVQQAKWEILAECIMFLAEMAFMTAMAFFTGGTSLTQAWLLRARTTLTILMIIDRLSRLTHIGPSLVEGIEEAMISLGVGLAQMGLNPDDRRIKNIDWLAVVKSFAFGAIAGGVISVFSTLGNFFKNVGAKFFKTDLPGDLGKFDVNLPTPGGGPNSRFDIRNAPGWVVGVGISGAAEGFGEGVAEALFGVFEGNGWNFNWDTVLYGTTSGAIGDVVGGGLAAGALALNAKFFPPKIPPGGVNDANTFRNNMDNGWSGDRTGNGSDGGVDRVNGVNGAGSGFGAGSVPPANAGQLPGDVTGGSRTTPPVLTPLPTPVPPTQAPPVQTPPVAVPTSGGGPSNNGFTERTDRIDDSDGPSRSDGPNGPDGSSSSDRPDRTFATDGLPNRTTTPVGLNNPPPLQTTGGLPSSALNTIGAARPVLSTGVSPYRSESGFTEAYEDEANGVPNASGTPLAHTPAVTPATLPGSIPTSGQTPTGWDGNRAQTGPAQRDAWQDESDTEETPADLPAVTPATTPHSPTTGQTPTGADGNRAQTDPAQHDNGQDEFDGEPGAGSDVENTFADAPAVTPAVTPATVPSSSAAGHNPPGWDSARAQADAVRRDHVWQQQPDAPADVSSAPAPGQHNSASFEVRRFVFEGQPVTDLTIEVAFASAGTPTDAERETAWSNLVDGVDALFHTPAIRLPDGDLLHITAVPATAAPYLTVDLTGPAGTAATPAELARQLAQRAGLDPRSPVSVAGAIGPLPALALAPAQAPEPGPARPTPTASGALPTTWEVPAAAQRYGPSADAGADEVRGVAPAAGLHPTSPLPETGETADPSVRPSGVPSNAGQAEIPAPPAIEERGPGLAPPRGGAALVTSGRGEVGNELAAGAPRTTPTTPVQATAYSGAQGSSGPNALPLILAGAAPAAPAPSATPPRAPAPKPVRDALARLWSQDPVYGRHPLDRNAQDTMARQLLHLPADAKVDDAVRAELTTLVLDAVDKGHAGNLAALGAHHFRTAGSATADRPVTLNGKKGPGRNWTSDPSADLDTTRVVSHVMGQPVPTADKAPWHGVPLTLLGETGGPAGVHVPWPGGGHRWMSAAEVAEYLVVEAKGLPADVEILLAWPNSGDGGLHLARLVAHLTGRTVWVNSGPLTAYAPPGATAKPGGPVVLTAFGGPGQPIGDWFPVRPDEWRDPRPDDVPEWWEAHWATRTIVTADHQQTGRSAFPPNDPNLESIYRDLRRLPDYSGRAHFNPVTRELVGPVESPPTAKLFHYSHGGPGTYEVPLDNGSVITVSAEEYAGALSRRPSVRALGDASAKQVAQGGPPLEMFVGSCFTGTGSNLPGGKAWTRSGAPAPFVRDELRTLSGAEHVANRTRLIIDNNGNRTSLTVGRGGRIYHGLETDVRGRPGQRRKAWPEPLPDQLADRARTAGLYTDPGKVSPDLDAARRLNRALRTVFGDDVDTRAEHPTLLAEIGALELLRRADTRLSRAAPHFTMELLKRVVHADRQKRLTKRVVHADRQKRTGTAPSALTESDFRHTLSRALTVVKQAAADTAAAAAAGLAPPPAPKLSDFVELPLILGVARTHGQPTESELRSVLVLDQDAVPKLTSADRSEYFWTQVRAQEVYERQPDVPAFEARILHLAQPDPQRSVVARWSVARALATGRDAFDVDALAAANLEFQGLRGAKTLIKGVGGPTGRNHTGLDPARRVNLDKWLVPSAPGATALRAVDTPWGPTALLATAEALGNGRLRVRQPGGPWYEVSE
ncbi:lonely Cys domain-containing protein, partial [Streptomyces sp. NPDC000618]|uniref:lonely Cys domain-containing protein n=1 Tax=Streptomyces sp. NPDC000618 TaxID=3154265 RepID=UPI003319C702